MAEAIRTAPPAMETSGESPSTRTRLSASPSLLIPLGAVVLALVLRLYDLGHEPLWLDEGYTLLFSRLPLTKLFLVGGAHEHPPLYYLIVHTVLSINNWYLVPRIISAIAGALAVFAIYLLGRQLGGRATGFIAAALTAVAPFHVWYSRDGRGYELAGLLVISSYLLLFQALQQPRRMFWILYAAALAGCLYAEYTTIFVLIPQGLMLVRARELRLTKPLLLAWLGASLLFLPWIGTLMLDALGIAGDYWIPAPNPTEVGNTMLEFLGVMTPCPNSPCSGHLLLPSMLSGHTGVLALTAALAAALAGLWALSRRSLTVGVLVLWLVLPFVLVLFIALFRSLYLDRIFLDATFPLYLLIGLAVASARRLVVRTLAVALAALLFATALANLQPIYAGSMNPDWKSVGRDLGSAYTPGQAVVFDPGVLQSLVGAYLPPGWRPSRQIPLWSQAYVDVPGWQKRFPSPFHPSKAERQLLEARLRTYQLSLAAAGGRSVWLVTYDYPGLNDARRWFADRNYEPLVSQIYFGDTRLELWSPAGPEAWWKGIVPFPGLGTGWRLSRGTHIEGRTLHGTKFRATQDFSMHGGGAYTITMEYQGFPQSSKPTIEVQVFDARGTLLGTFPRTQWYDFPANGVWISQPFGFIAPPGSARARVIVGNDWGQASFRNIAVYQINR